MYTGDAVDAYDGEHRVREAVRQAAVDGRMSCACALNLAGRLGVPPAVVGRVCDRLGIKIASCQLGCFR